MIFQAAPKEFRLEITNTTPTESPGIPLRVLWGLGGTWEVYAKPENWQEAAARLRDLLPRLENMERGWIYAFDERGLPIQRVAIGVLQCWQEGLGWQEEPRCWTDPHAP